MSRPVHVQVCCLKTDAEASLTQTQKHHGRFGERRVRWREVELGLGPTQPALVEPGQDVVPAQGLGMGHQLLLGQRAVEYVQDLCSEDGGPTQDFHVLLRGIWVKRGADLWVSSVCFFFGFFYPRGIRFNGQHCVASGCRGESFLERNDHKRCCWWVWVQSRQTAWSETYIIIWWRRYCWVTWWDS